ncbi:hypothetical protein M758_1G282500 [Ceratodon purpureus]|uniref:Uncharacterized protein n=1 Tax=Ceratodon purpureus TaxID=3225 RepID=A0A8T0JAZ7_CERPU|nr:hypothetical protein KC19_1G291000 [Ceratodon purpureus]KAG0631832.1 hypothetical protein M758_1G282500 [Ceratodon purpureus]
MLLLSRCLWRPVSFKHLLVSPRLRPGVAHRSLVSISCSTPCPDSVTYSSPDWGSLFRSSALSWTIREAHTGTAGKSHGRRKKSINSTSLQYTKRGGILQETTEGDVPEDYEERDSKGQSKRKSLRALKWGTQLATLSPSQLRQAIRWASLDEEVYEAVMLVKSMGVNVKNGKRRQFNYIGGLLRDADPVLMEQVLTACQDGDLSGLMARMHTKSESSEDEIDENDASEKTEYHPEEEKVARQWLQGLLDGDEAANYDVFSSTSDVYFDRQELKKLLRMAKGTQDLKPIDRSVEATKAHDALFDFLYNLAQQRKTND